MDTNNTLYLVTGAAGFLASTVCRQLVEQGCNVRGFILPNDPAKIHIPEEGPSLPPRSQKTFPVS